MRGLRFIGVALLAVAAVDAFGFMSVEKTTCRRHSLPQQVDSVGACGCGCQQGSWAVPVVGLDCSQLPTLYTYEDNSGVFDEGGHHGGCSYGGSGCSCGGNDHGCSCGANGHGCSCGGNGRGCSCGGNGHGCSCGGNGGNGSGCSCGRQAGSCACGGNGGVCTCGAKHPGLCTCGAKKDSGICTCGAKKDGGICTCGAKKDDEICSCGAKKNGGVCTCGKKKESDGPKPKHKDDCPVKDIAAEGISAFFKVVHGGIKMVEHFADKINKDKCVGGPKKACKCGGGCAPGCGCRCGC